MAKGKKCKDHEGREFPSIAAMCAYWEISEELFYARRRAGYSLEQILTMPVRKRRNLQNGPYFDHEGNEFNSKAERGIAWGKNWLMVDRLLAKGYTLEQALTADLSIQDFLGNKFRTYTEAGTYWELSRTTLYSRLRKSADKALTTKMLRNRKLSVPETKLENLDAILETSLRKELDSQVKVTEKSVKIGRTERPRFLLGDVISTQQYVHGDLEFVVVKGYNFAELYSTNKNGIHVCFTSDVWQRIAS